MAISTETSKIVQLGKVAISAWLNSTTYGILRQVYLLLVQTTSSMFLARLFSPYQPGQYQGWGTSISRSLRRSANRVFLKGLSWFRKSLFDTATLKRAFSNFLLDCQHAPVNVIGELLFGFSATYFSLSLYSLRLGGLQWILVATALLVLGLVGTAAPSEYLQSSFLQKLSSKPFKKRKELLLPILIGVLIGALSYIANPFLILAIIVALVGSLLIVLRPEFGLYGIAAYAMIDYFVRSNLPASIARIWPLALMALILIGILIRIVKESERKFYFTEAVIPLLLFLLWNCVSLVENTVSFSVGFEGIRAILQTSIFFFLSLNAVRDRKKLHVLLYFLTGILLVISLYAIYQHIIQVPVKPGWVDVDFEQDIKTRSYSIFPSPNALSGYLVLFFPLVLVLFLEEKGWASKIYFLGAALTMGLALMYTLTRAGWLVCALSLLLLGLLHDRRVLVFLLILALALPFLPEFSTRLATMITGEYWVKSATAGRLYRWELGLEIASGHPLFGTGPGTFGGAVAYRAGYWPGIYADNYYIKTASELGFVGLGLYSLTLLFILIGGFRRLRSLKDKMLKNIGWAMQAGIFAFLAHNFTENLWEEPPLAVAFWFLCGLLFLLPLLERENVQSA
ncbi:MAG: O-antigen ligase family protein [bacterium]